MLDKIVFLIEESGWKEGAFESMAGLPQGRISKWKGGTGEPTATQALAMARLLRVSVEYLIDDAIKEPVWRPDLPEDEAHVLRVYRNLKRTGSLDEDLAVTGLVALSKTDGRLFGPPPGYEHGVGRPVADKNETEGHLRRQQIERDDALAASRRKAQEERTPKGRANGKGGSEHKGSEGRK